MPAAPLPARGTAFARCQEHSRLIAAARSEVHMGLLLFVLFGLIVGFLARAIMPGRQSMGLIMTSILGMVGSLLGGFLASLISNNDVNRIHAAGLIGSILGALVVLALVSMGSRR